MKRKYPFAIIEQLVKELAGEDMNEKINVLDVNIDSCTAKEAMKEPEKRSARGSFLKHP